MRRAVCLQGLELFYVIFKRGWLGCNRFTAEILQDLHARISNVSI